MNAENEVPAMENSIGKCVLPLKKPHIWKSAINSKYYWNLWLFNDKISKWIGFEKAFQTDLFPTKRAFKLLSPTTFGCDDHQMWWKIPSSQLFDASQLKYPRSVFLWRCAYTKRIEKVKRRNDCNVTRIKIVYQHRFGVYVNEWITMNRCVHHAKIIKQKRIRAQQILEWCVEY